MQAGVQSCTSGQENEVYPIMRFQHKPSGATLFIGFEEGVCAPIFSFKRRGEDAFTYHLTEHPEEFVSAIESALTTAWEVKIFHGFNIGESGYVYGHVARHLNPRGDEPEFDLLFKFGIWVEEKWDVIEYTVHVTTEANLKWFLRFFSGYFSK